MEQLPYHTSSVSLNTKLPAQLEYLITVTILVGSKRKLIFHRKVGLGYWSHVLGLRKMKRLL